VEHQTFRLRDYNRFLLDHRADIAAFKAKQQQAFNAERERWDRLGLSKFESASITDDGPGSGAGSGPGGDNTLAPGLEPVFSEVTGNVWKVLARAGQEVREGERLAILESMKTEIEVLSPATGRLTDAFCEVGKLVSAGQLLFAIRPGEG